MTQKLAWGIIGTGNIAAKFAGELPASRTGYLAAVGSRAAESAQRFGDAFNAPQRHDSYEALLADTSVQAVYVATPHPQHAQWAIGAAEAGKHVLCEKPLAMNHAEAQAMVEAARRNDVFLMEAFMYRCHPQTAKLVELIRDGAIGEVRLIQAEFGFHSSFDPASRLFDNALGGGAILDVGCYCVSMARLVAGAATGRDFAEPVEVQALGRLGETSRVDEYAAALLRFPGDIIAQLATAVQLNLENVVRVYGTTGRILVPSPWFCAPADGAANIVVQRNDGSTQEITVETGAELYAAEADVVAGCLEARQALPPAMTWDDTLGNMKTLDAWRAAIGLMYDAERT